MKSISMIMHFLTRVYFERIETKKKYVSFNIQYKGCIQRFLFTWNHFWIRSIVRWATNLVLRRLLQMSHEHNSMVCSPQISRYCWFIINVFRLKILLKKILYQVFGSFFRNYKKNSCISRWCWLITCLFNLK